MAAYHPSIRARHTVVQHSAQELVHRLSLLVC
jgi:hypothetical protein